jgi:hypothetical protein
MTADSCRQPFQRTHRSRPRDFSSSGNFSGLGFVYVTGVRDRARKIRWRVQKKFDVLKFLIASIKKLSVARSATKTSLIFYFQNNSGFLIVMIFCRTCYAPVSVNSVL